MGKISQGILGGLSGKVGNVIGGSWKGIDYIRIKPSSVANPRTVGQVNQRTKFTATLEFLQAVKPFIKHEIANRTRHQLRRMPELQFYIDDSLEYIDGIDKSLKGSEDPIQNPDLLPRRKKS